MITLECRQESHKKTDKQTRYNEILNVLHIACNPLTARQIAYRLDYKDLNAVKPRLTELVSMKKVKVAGKEFDKLTQRNVSTYEVI